MCDTLVRLGDDGVLFAKNSDRDPNEAQVLRWHEATDHGAGAEVVCTWITIPQAARTHAVLLSQPWWMWGAEIGANEHGVVIGNEAVFTRDLLLGRRDPDALLGMDLVRLGLERAATATEAVGVMVDLLETHGQGGSCSHDHPKFRYHNSFLVADADGATVLETAGRAWATEEVRGPSRAISNGLTIPDFAKAHADPIKSKVTACALRRARTEPGAAAAEGPADLFALLRDHGPHGSPRWSRVHGGLTAPCVHAGGTFASSQTTASWVADLRDGVQHWATATSGPCTSLFKPVSVDEPVDLGPAPTNAIDDRTTWWRHEPLHRLTLRDHTASIARYGAERDRTEALWLADVPTSAHAFAVAGVLERRWLDDLTSADLPDRRPHWVRQQWRHFDEAAHP
ncbi:MAG: peptidase dipeptidase [Ilumatobacteraceae bacterium]|nr:peptidase dipeptidase [Ilumatobacteraceae bacterium]